MNNISLLLKELNVICEDYERRENLGSPDNHWGYA